MNSNTHKNLKIKHRLLGIYSTISGNTSRTGELLAQKSKAKMATTYVPKGGPKLASIISNTSMSPTISCSSLTANMTLEDLNSLDTQIIKKI